MGRLGRSDPSVLSDQSGLARLSHRWDPSGPLDLARLSHRSLQSLRVLRADPWDLADPVCRVRRGLLADPQDR